jgi:hypothetical protein
MLHWKLMRLATQAFWLTALMAAAPLLFADTTSTESRPTGSIVMIQAAPGVIHFNPSPAHADYSWLVGVEWQHHSQWVAGFSYFNNSFGQKSQYYYGGYWWRLSEGNPNWYFKLTGGLLVGYKDPYEDDVPFNHNGYSPGVVPAVGYKWNRFNVQLNLLGTAALMVTVGYDLIR